MNYSNFRKYAKGRLNSLKEDLIRTVNIPENTISYDGVIGSYILNPFSADEYSFDVMLNTQEDMDSFLKKLSKSDIFDNIVDNSNVKFDSIHNNFVVTGFINKALLQDIQMEFKNILNNIK